jgi:exopolysaccharide biosynthesis protein
MFSFITQIAYAENCAELKSYYDGNVNIVSINMNCPKLKILSTSENERGMTVSDFANKTNSKIAINGGFFREGFYPFGLTITRGYLWNKSRDVINRSFLACDINNKCYIDPINHVQTDITSIFTSIPGWQTLNTDFWKFECAVGEGERCKFGKFNTKQPRTAIGLDNRRSILYVVVANGRLAKFEGLTLDELGRIFKRLNVDAALNLDGGGSSTLVVNGHRVSKLPDDQPHERVVANHLGFTY